MNPEESLPPNNLLMKAMQPHKAASTANKSGPFFQKGGNGFFQPSRSAGFFSGGAAGGSVGAARSVCAAGAVSAARSGVVQTKLTIGQPNDTYEKEADSVADKVVQRLSYGGEQAMTPAITPLAARTGITALNTRAAATGNTAPAPGTANGMTASAPSAITTIAPVAARGIIQEKCAHCEEEEKKHKEKDRPAIRKKPIFDSNTEPEENIQRKCAACEKEEKMQRKPDGATPGVSPQIESRLASSKGRGAPLPDSTRHHMESAFGRDLGAVRIHTDAGAVQMSRDLNAQAFTHASDIYFDSGKYDSSASAGRHLLAHELTHVVQQGGAGQRLQRLPSLSDIGQGLSDAYDSASSTVSDAYDSASQTVQQAGQDLYNAGADAVNTVTDAASDAVDWIETQAGKAALALANEVIGHFGGSVTIVGTTIIIDIPDVPLFQSFQKEIGSLPSIPVLEIPLFGGGIGIFEFLATLEVNITPSLLAALGPAELRGIRLSFNPAAMSFAGHAELYIAAALGERLSIFGGLVGRGLGILPTEPPIPLEASLEGGIRGTGTGWEIGALDTTVDVTYSSGSWTFTADNNIMLGMLLQGDLDFYSAVKVFEEMICEYSYPARHWETGKAMNINIPISLGGSGTPVIGPVDTTPIPIENIETAIEPLQHGLRCPGFPPLDDFIKDLCAKKELPEWVCAPKGPLPPGKGPKGVPVVCARPLEIPVAGLFAQHAFVNDPITGNNYAIRDLVPHTGKGIKSCTTTTTASPTPDDVATSSCKACEPPSGKTLADVSACLLHAHMAYASPNLYQNFPDPADGFNWGPNSNTYAATLAKCCADPSSTGLGIVPGWNHTPATPCPSVPGPSGPTGPGGGGGTVTPAAAACVPTFKSLTAKKTGAIQMTDAWPGNRCELAFGAPSAPGMSFEAKVDVPAGCTGTLAFLQLIDRCDQRTNAAGADERIKTGGFVLDTSDPYSDKKVTAPGLFTMSDSDSPGAGFTSTNTFLFGTDQFTMWVMWTPDAPAGAPRVPMAKVNWNWTAKSNKTGTTGCASAWTISADSASGGTGSPTSTAPSWTKEYPKDFPKYTPGAC